MIGKKVRIGVSLLVGNMDNMVRFYRDILGFKTQWSAGDFADFETASGELSLFMYSREARFYWISSCLPKAAIVLDSFWKIISRNFEWLLNKGQILTRQKNRLHKM